MDGKLFSYPLAAVADLLMPRECLVCGRRLLVHEHHLCIWCSDSLPLTRFWLSPRNPMADRFNALIQARLEREGTEPIPYAHAAALFYYSSRSEYGNITRSLKYHGALGAGRHFSRLLAAYLKGCPTFSDAELFVPVPLHRSRQWKRGYNQAWTIALAVASELGKAAQPALLKRHRRTRTQTRLDIEQKASNVAGAFSVDGKKMEALLEADVRHIVLVDDVFTTGTTLEECHAAIRTWLRDNGKARYDLNISIITLGFVG